MLNQFHLFASLPRCFTSYFVTLIPKMNSYSQLGNFEPIFLLGSYKLVAKFLEVRLVEVMDNIISLNQSTFLKGRLLVDEVVVVNELVDLAKKSKKVLPHIFKADFEKVMTQSTEIFWAICLSGLGSIVSGDLRCVLVFFKKIMVLVNGCPTQKIRIQKGQKQSAP